MVYKIGMHPNSKKNLLKHRCGKRNKREREKISKTIKRRYKEGIKMGGFYKGHPDFSPNAPQKQKGYKWNDKIIKKRMKAMKMTPNKLEKELIDLFKKYDLPYRFVGDGKIIIHNKCPDFINCNGKKKIIELFGNYWHKPKEEKQRKKLFKKYGYETLIIWEHEMKNKIEVLDKIIKFNRGD